jgi:hypothetical protein
MKQTVESARRWTPNVMRLKMNEGYRMRKHSLLFRSAAVAACTGLLATMWACTGDDSSPGDDGGGSSSSSSGSSGSSSSSGGSSGSSSGGTVGSSSSSGGSSSSGSSSGAGGSSGGSADAGRDSGSSSSSSGSSSGSSGANGGSDASNEAASDAARDSTVADSTVDGNGGDVVTADANDGAADAGRDQLAWCPSLDITFADYNPDGGVGPAICATETPNGLCPQERADTWANNVVGIAGDFLNLLYADCRIEAMGAPPVITSTEGADYLNQVTIWTLAFFGCPDPTQDLGPFNGFGLIPKSLSGHTFTTADVRLLEDMYVAGINQALTDNGSPILTVDQTTQVRASLVSWAASVLPTPSSTYSYSDPSTCASDGGAVVDAAGSDGGTDGSTDAGGG